MTVPSQAVVNYSYDTANRLTQITQGSNTITLTYDTAGRRSTLTFPNGIVLTYGYDAASRVASLLYTKGGATGATLAYNYDKHNRRLSPS